MDKIPVSEKPPDNDDDQANQKHNHGDSVDAVHHAEIKIVRTARVFLAEIIPQYRTQIEIFFPTVPCLFCTFRIVVHTLFVFNLIEFLLLF
jgi:hypothetical protein